MLKNSRIYNQLVIIAREGGKGIDSLRIDRIIPGVSPPRSTLFSVRP